jgi:hypothetical protein
MGKARKLHRILLGGLFTATGCCTTGTFGEHEVPSPPMDSTVMAPPATSAPPNHGVVPELPPVPAAQADGHPLPIARTRKLAPAIVPDLELFRAETELARRQETELLARERWKVSGAELLRVLRLDPAAQVEPVEPPQLRVELIDLKKPVDDLIRVGLTYRPELASQQAQVQATLALLRQEQLRPLIPSILLRGYSTPVTGTLGAGYFGGGPNDSFGNGALRSDFDLQVLWQLNNLGFGNRALVHQREAESRLAMVDLFRIEDRVAAEVSQAHAQAQQAARRVEVTQTGVPSAVLSADKNLTALSQTKGVGNQLVTLVRPQEAVAAIQALSQAYIDYYGPPPTPTGPSSDSIGRWDNLPSTSITAGLFRGKETGSTPICLQELQETACHPLALLRSS